jgi:hypothetical protein
MLLAWLALAIGSPAGVIVFLGLTAFRVRLPDAGPEESSRMYGGFLRFGAAMDAVAGVAAGALIGLPPLPALLGAALFFGLKVAAAQALAWLSNRKIPERPSLTRQERERKRERAEARMRELIASQRLQNPWLFLGSLALAHLGLLLAVLVPLRVWLAG